MSVAPLDRKIDELRAAYMAIPVGYVTPEDVAAAMPNLAQAVEAVLRESGRLCDACGKDHSRENASDVEHDDFALILDALGLGSHARPKSRHAIVHTEILPAIRELTNG